MGLGCSKQSQSDGEEGSSRDVVRLSPFRPRRCSLRRRSGAPTAGAAGEPGSLLSLAADALAASLHQQAPTALACLPADLSQLLLERLVAQGRLDDAAIAALDGAGLLFYGLPLGGYPELVRPAWLACLTSASLEAADLSKTGVTDAGLAALGAPPRLARLRLDFCVDLTDAGLASLQGLTALEELSLTGCEQLTPLGLQWLGGLARLRRLSLQTCHHVCGLAQLAHLQRLEALDLGWCSAIGDADTRALACFGRLRELNLARTQAREGSTCACSLRGTHVTDAGLAHLRGLSRLETLNLAGLRVSDEALAALLCLLPRLRALSLERCLDAGDLTLGALAKHLRLLSVENCGVGDRGLQVVSSLSALQSLDISDTGASNACMPAVGSLHRLECLNLSFTNAGMVHLAGLAGLECLDLFGARISDAGCASLSKLMRLRRLEVCGGSVTDVGVAHLAALTSLQHLSLAQNDRLGNGAVKHLIKLSHLTALNLSQSRVTSNHVVALGCLPQLQTLALHQTNVKPFAVDTLLAANPDLEVQGVPPSRYARTVAPPGLLQVLQAAA